MQKNPFIVKIKHKQCKGNYIFILDNNNRILLQYANLKQGQQQYQKRKRICNNRKEGFFFKSGIK